MVTNPTIIDINVYQMTPSEKMLSQPAEKAILALIDSGRTEDETIIGKLLSANTVADLMQTFVAGNREHNQWLTRIMNSILSGDSVFSELGWTRSERGLLISEPEVLVENDGLQILTAKYASLRADRCINGRNYFNVAVRSKVFFDKNISLVSAVDDLKRAGGQYYLPVLDAKNAFNCVVRGFQDKPLYHKLPGKNIRIGEILVKHHRMTQLELNQRYKKAENGDIDAARLTICWCTPYASDKRYAYLPHHLEIIASNALQGEVLKRSKQMPERLLNAAKLCDQAFKLVRQRMDDKVTNFLELEEKLSPWFESLPPIQAKFSIIYPKKRERFNLKKQVDSKDELQKLNRKNIILYPTAGTTESEKIFRGYFTGPTCQMRKLGFEFEFMNYDQQISTQKPMTIIERIKDKVGDDANVVMAWRRGKNGNLHNNRIIELELMRHGMAVQHVVDEGQRGNAHKVGNLLQAITKKFTLVPCDMNNIESIFDLTLGLDVSRFNYQDIAAFPVSADNMGRISIFMPKDLQNKHKEKRSESEITESIFATIAGRSRSEEKFRVLFLRDGLAFEDYEKIAQDLPSYVSLTVISIRKNLLTSFSEKMPEGNFYTLYADHDENRFLFGVNARQGKFAKLSSLHMAEIIRNPEKYSKEALATILIELSKSNITTEFELASLPFPIAYADRTSWTIRDLIQDRQLKKYARETYPDQVSKCGDESRYIYSVIRDYVLTHHNGYAFAI